MISKKTIYAGRLDRLFANLIDTFIVLVPSSLCASILGGGPITLLAAFLCNAGYYTLFNSSAWQATPGKRLMKIYIVRVNGQKLGQAQALERFLAFILPSLPVHLSFLSENSGMLLVFWLSIFWFSPILFRDDRAGIHDRICDTRVMIGRLGA